MWETHPTSSPQSHIPLLSRYSDMKQPWNILLKLMSYILQAMDLFLSVPRKLMITTDTAKRSVLGEFILFVNIHVQMKCIKVLYVY